MLFTTEPHPVEPNVRFLTILVTINISTLLRYDYKNIRFACKMYVQLASLCNVETYF